MDIDYRQIWDMSMMSQQLWIHISSIEKVAHYEYQLSVKETKF